jgi:hypothetical protein
MGQLEQWGSQHKCKMIHFGSYKRNDVNSKCHCICGDPSINRDLIDRNNIDGIVDGRTKIQLANQQQNLPYFANGTIDGRLAVKGKAVTDWFNHVHVDFIRHTHNKYFDYLDNKDSLANPTGKARAKCVGDLYKGNCGGTGTPSYCKAGHRGSFPTTGHCPEQNGAHPSPVPTPAPTAIGHDGWGNPK